MQAQHAWVLLFVSKACLFPTYTDRNPSFVVFTREDFS